MRGQTEQLHSMMLRIQGLRLAPNTGWADFYSLLTYAWVKNKEGRPGGKRATIGKASLCPILRCSCYATNQKHNGFCFFWSCSNFLFLTSFQRIIHFLDCNYPLKTRTMAWRKKMNFLFIYYHFPLCLICFGTSSAWTREMGPDRKKKRPADLVWLHHHIPSSASKPARIKKG